MSVRLGTKNPNRQVKLMVAGYRRQKIAFVSKIRQVCTRRANFWFPSTVQTVVG